ncbi:hypothetical protein HPP92_017413 [Vanilla planifolia]|uniref:Uncharacterized protein n=1 Tax=Vanilla planifolia TaxID=51239 RepID=A0A835QFZ2_VANPL|nr:hypothetical protein HPP92_017413 [Vanilla planifolia]
MELVDKLEEPDGMHCCTLFGFKGGPFESSPPTDPIGFTFPVPPITEENNFADRNVFFRGDFLTWKSSSVPPPPAEAQRANLGKPKIRSFSHRRADSLDWRDHRVRVEAQTIDYHRLRRASSDARQAPAKGLWQKWPLLVLGSMRLPAEMEMNDIRNRLKHRAPAAELTAPGWWKSRWGILRVLSCKAAENTVTTQIGAPG